MNSKHTDRTKGSQVQTHIKHLITKTEPKQHIRIGIICTKNGIGRRIHDFVGDGAGRRGAVHMHIMRGNIEADQELEEEGIGWVCHGEIHYQRRCCTSIVEY